MPGPAAALWILTVHLVESPTKTPSFGSVTRATGAARGQNAGGAGKCARWAGTVFPHGEPRLRRFGRPVGAGPAPLRNPISRSSREQWPDNVEILHSMERKHSPGVFSCRQMQSFHVNLGVDSRYSASCSESVPSKNGCGSAELCSGMRSITRRVIVLIT